MNFAKQATAMTCNQALITSTVVGVALVSVPQLRGALTLLPLPPWVHVAAAGALTTGMCRVGGYPTMYTPVNEVLYGAGAALGGGYMAGKYSTTAIKLM